MRQYGLIGYPLGHSFSAQYFGAKFEEEAIAAAYLPYPIPNIALLPQLVSSNNLQGLNVTVPYKQQVLAFLDEIDAVAAQIGAINTIKVEEGILKGYNTDYYGFLHSLQPFIANSTDDLQALVLGTGGSSLAVAAVLRDQMIPYKTVGRHGKGDVDWSNVNPQLLQHFKLIINCTPVGMYPQVDDLLPLPYDGIGPGHYCYDLIYNPEETPFLAQARSRGAATKNGLEMLHLQAERSWTIWNT